MVSYLRLGVGWAGGMEKGETVAIEYKVSERRMCAGAARAAQQLKFTDRMHADSYGPGTRT